MSNESSKKPATKALASAKTDVIKSSLLLIDALAGNDRITGGSLGQTIYGGSGNDMLQGAGGNDILWGDGSSTAAAFVAGRDTFVFEKTLAANGVDTVMDFCVTGHKTAGVLQTGSFVADTLDLSRVKFTGPASLASNDDGDDHHGDDDGKDGDESDHGDDNEDGDDDFHITAANVNDYVTIKGGELYIDTDGLGAGQAQVWAHLNGVSGGDLVNLKLDDFTGRIEAKNALATITGNSSGAVTEDGTLLASGTLSVVDTDRGENTFQAAAAPKGSYGDFSFNAVTGAWSFALNSAAVQTLHADESFFEVLTVKSLDGTATQDITVTVQGAQDVAVITGDITGAVAEDANLTVASGILVATDADHDESSFRVVDSAALKGSYGDFSFSAVSGAWSYTLDNTAAAVQALAAGQKQTDKLTVATADGTTQDLIVTITGSNDAAVITGTPTAALTETNEPLSVNGVLFADDVDSSNAFRVQTDVAGSNGYGTFSIGAAGDWTYNAGAHDEFAQGQVYTDSLTVATADGTQQVLTVSITGSNDGPYIISPATASFAENGTGNVLNITTSIAKQGDELYGSISGADGYLFYMDESGGLHFESYDYGLPNFEAPLDSGRDNTYNITVHINGISAGKDVAITVTDVGGAGNPVLTSAASASCAENTSGTVYTATASYAEIGSALTYTLGGADAGLFIINPNGTVDFNDLPNFEAPSDANKDNVYNITITANDGPIQSDALDVAITVTNVTGAQPGHPKIIDLDSYGTLVDPVQVEGKWYYLWDRTDDFLVNNDDKVDHNVLDAIFTQDANGATEVDSNKVGLVGETDNTFRYATLSGIAVALPTANGTDSNLVFGQRPNGTTYSDDSKAGSNGTFSSSFDELMAIWDAFTGPDESLAGRPELWEYQGVDSLWSATTGAVDSAHTIVSLDGYIDSAVDLIGYVTVLQVL